MATEEDVNVTDQDALTPEELKMLADNEAAGDDVEGDEGAAAPAAVVAPKPAKKTAPAAAAKVEGAEGGDGSLTAEEIAAAAEAGKAGDKTVPLAALHESRAEIKRLREERTAEKAAEAERFGLLEKRTNEILAKLVPKEEAPKAEVIPDFDIDPAGWIAGTMKASGKDLEAVKAELTTLRQEKATQDEANRNRAGIQEILTYAITQENQFKAVTPDYDAASTFLLNSRKDELEEMGKTPAEINQIIQLEKLSIANDCKNSGKNPAEVVYKIAKRRGYAKAADADPVVDAAAAAATGKEKLETARRGTEQAQSLSGTRGNAPSPLTAQRLLEMSEAEFAKAIATPEGRALMGS